MTDKIRALLAGNPLIPIQLDAISDSANLYDAGLTSFASVQLMLAVEEEFNIEFPEEKLTRRTFSSIANIAAAVSELTAEPV